MDDKFLRTVLPLPQNNDSLWIKMIDHQDIWLSFSILTMISHFLIIRLMYLETTWKVIRVVIFYNQKFRKWLKKHFQLNSANITVSYKRVKWSTKLWFKQANRNKLFYLLRPWTFHKFGIKNFLPPVQALNICPVFKTFRCNLDLRFGKHLIFISFNSWVSFCQIDIGCNCWVWQRSSTSVVG